MTSEERESTLGVSGTRPHMCPWTDKPIGQGIMGIAKPPSSREVFSPRRLNGEAKFASSRCFVLYIVQ